MQYQGGRKNFYIKTTPCKVCFSRELMPTAFGYVSGFTSTWAKEASMTKRKGHDPETLRDEKRASEEWVGTPGAELRDWAKRNVVGQSPIEMEDDKVLIETFGTNDRYFVRGLIGQLITAGSIGGDVARSMGGDGYDFMVAVMRGAKPKDHLAAMLLAQMAATHMAIMKVTDRFARTNDLERHDSIERNLNKLLRAFPMQLEAFNRYQNGGEQRVTVQHVSVSEGSQAIVGNVTQNALAEPADETPAITDARQEEMSLISDKLMREPVPLRRGRK